MKTTLIMKTTKWSLTNITNSEIKKNSIIDSKLNMSMSNDGTTHTYLKQNKNTLKSCKGKEHIFKWVNKKKNTLNLEQSFIDEKY